MFRIKLLILLSISFLFFSCTKNDTDQNKVKYTLGYIDGEYDGLVLKNLLMNNLSNLGLYSDESIYEIKAKVAHSEAVFITNIDNTSDRMRLDSRLYIDVINLRFDCVAQKFDESKSQFYIFAESDRYISNNMAEKKIKEENVEALVKEFINKLKKPSKFCKKINE